MTFWPTELDLQTAAALLLAIASLCGLFFYYLFFFLRPGIQKRMTPADRMDWPAVSVVICAHNEEQNIIANLPRILEQDYPQFEVVVVNDDSWDQTGDELLNFQQVYSHLKVVTVEEHVQRRPGKKFPLTLGIKKASHELLIFTDADCVPESNQWLRHMAAGFQSGKEVVLGMSPAKPAKGLVNALVRFETLLTAMFYSGFALAGFPYMGVGRNLGYTRSAYDVVGGFKKHYHIMSGDDDLLVRDIARKKNTAVIVHPDALMWTSGPDSWLRWWRQKRRHYSTATHYRWGSRLMLGLYPLFLTTWLVAVIYLFTCENTQYIASVLLATKVMTQLVIFRLSFRVLKDKYIWAWSPLLEVVLLANQFALLVAALFSKQKKWK
ncbi:MAG: glycosyltransferase [Cryomorphaceae bacterium]|nr:MAG: glycosyltransferase [Cryomorphaceae bacterium]